MPSRRNCSKRSSTSPLPLGADAHSLHDWRLVSSRRHASSTRPQSYSSFHSHRVVASNVNYDLARWSVAPGRIPEVSARASKKKMLRRWKRMWWPSLIVTQLVLMSAVVAGVLTVQSALAGNLSSRYLTWCLASVGGVVIGGVVTGILGWRRRVRMSTEREWWVREVMKWERKCKEVTMEMKKTKEVAERLRDGHRRLSRVRSVAESIVSRGRSRGNRKQSWEVRQGKEIQNQREIRGGRDGHVERDLERGETIVGIDVGLQVTEFTMVERERQPRHQKDRTKLNMIDKGQSVKTSIEERLPTEKDRTIVIPEEGRPKGSSWKRQQQSTAFLLSDLSQDLVTNATISELEGDIPGFGNSRDFGVISLDGDVMVGTQRQQLYNGSRNMTHSSDLGVGDNIFRPGDYHEGIRPVERNGRLHRGSPDNEQLIDARQLSEGDGVHIVREGHGGMGSLQSDDNVIAAHELDEYAVSYDSTELELRRSRSQSRVRPWLEEHLDERINIKNSPDARAKEGKASRGSKRSRKDTRKEVKEWRESKRKERKKQLEIDLNKELPPLPNR